MNQLDRVIAAANSVEATGKPTMHAMQIQKVMEAMKSAKFDRAKHKPGDIIAHINGDPITYQQILDDMAKADEIRGLIAAASRGIALGLKA